VVNVDTATLLLFLLVPLLFVLLSVGLFLAVVRGLGLRLERVDLGPAEGFGDEGDGGWRRPWWGNPLVWLAAAAVFLVLGLLVAPHFLPGFVIFLPFVWVGGGRLRLRRPRCRSCGTELHPEHEFCPRCGTRVGG
jgi:hypothetical protein